MIAFSENFDGVIAPLLPPGWSSTAPPNSGSYLNTPWTTSNVNSFSQPNNAFIPELGLRGTSSLNSPSIQLNTLVGVLRFRNLFNLEQVDATIRDIAVQEDGKIIAVGFFNTIVQNGIIYERNNIARFFPDGTLDTSFNAGAVDNFISAVLIRPDGKIYVGGAFTIMGGQSKLLLALLESDGTLDLNFDANVSGGPVFTILIQPITNQLVFGGAFILVGGLNRQRIARVDPNSGMLDFTFNPIANQQVFDVVALVDGKLYLGGLFTTINGIIRERIARLDINGNLDLAFNAGVINASVRTIVPILGGNEILFGGAFTMVQGITRNRIASVDNTGFLTFFDPNSNGAVLDIVVQPDAKILVGGVFTNIGGLSRPRIARLNADGTGDNTFDAMSTGFSQVLKVVLLENSNVLVGGVLLEMGEPLTLLSPTGAFVPTFDTGIKPLAGDGLVLEISIDGGPFQDIIDAGGIFLTGGYNTYIPRFTSPIEGRLAWGLLSAGTFENPEYINTELILPASANGKSIILRWTIGVDEGGIAPGASGVRIDNVLIKDRIPCLHPNTLVLSNNCLKPISSIKKGDYITNHNGKSIEVLYNMCFTPSTDEFLKIPKDTLGLNKPSEDLLIRKEHPIMVNGRKVKADRLRIKYPQVKMITLNNPVNVWSLCTKDKHFVMMQGIPVGTWSQKEIESHRDFSFQKF